MVHPQSDGSFGLKSQVKRLDKKPHHSALCLRTEQCHHSPPFAILHSKTNSDETTSSAPIYGWSSCLILTSVSITTKCNHEGVACRTLPCHTVQHILGYLQHICRSGNTHYLGLITTTCQHEPYRQKHRSTWNMHPKIKRYFPTRPLWTVKKKKP